MTDAVANTSVSTETPAAPVVTPEVAASPAPVVETPAAASPPPTSAPSPEIAPPAPEIPPTESPQPEVPQPSPAPQPLPPTHPTAITIKDRLYAALEKVQFRKRAKLEKILVLAKAKRFIKNDDVEKLLRVSDATASRYLRQLVQEGKLKRSGSTKETVYETI
jgi:hypothetical protein